MDTKTKNQTVKTKTEIKNVKHEFTHDEREAMGGDLARSFGRLRGIETEFDQVKASYKSMTAEAEARIDRISTAITNGFEYKDAECVVVYHPERKEKDYYLSAADVTDPTMLPVLTERMTGEDFQQELIEAESAFDAKEEIELFQPTENDRGVLVVGRLAGKWFTALRVKIGKLELNERLNGEQRCFKDRAGSVAMTVKRFNAWAKENLKDLAAGFSETASAVAESHKERVE